MSTTQSTEARELSLVDKVEFRIALADSDSKLQNTLNTYLAPLLLKLDSAHASVRQKVVTICQQVLTRIKPQNIQLPVHALLKQYKENSQSRLIRHFDLLFLQHGIQRLSSSEQGSLVPLLIPGIASCASVTESQGAKILNFLLRALAKYQIPLRGQPESDALRSNLGASDDDASFLAFWFGKLFLLRLGSKSATTAVSGPGVSSNEWSFLTVEGNADTWDQTKEGGMNLTEAKVKCLHLLTSGFFHDDERFLPALFASADPNSRVSDTAEESVKRALHNVDLEDSVLIKKIFDYYLGFQPSGIDTSNVRVPGVSLAVRNKLVGILSRSVQSTTFTSEILAVVEKDLLQDVQGSNGTQNTGLEVTRLRTSLVSYLNFIARNAAKEDLGTISLPIIRYLREFIEQEAQEGASLESRNQRGTCFAIIGTLAAANRPILVEPKLELLNWLFQSLSQEKDKEVVVSIDEALSSVLRPLQRVENPAIQQALESLLSKTMIQESNNSRNLRYATVRFANRCLSYENVKARWLDIVALSNSASISHEASSEAKDGLNPHWHQTFESVGSKDPNIGFPGFAPLVDYFFWEKDAQNSNEASLMAIEFCRQALMWESLASQGTKIEFDFQWDLKLDQMVLEDEKARNAIRNQLKSQENDRDFRTALLSFWRYVLSNALSDGITFAKRVSAAKILAELCNLLPDSLLSQVASDFRGLETNLFANDLNLRLCSAQAYGILASHPNCVPQQVQMSLAEITSQIRSRGGAGFNQTNKIHGAVVATSHFISRRLYRKRDSDIALEALKGLLPEILQIIGESHNNLVYEASYHALSQLCMFFSVTPNMIESHLGLEQVIEKVHKSARDGSTTAIAALGYLSMIFDEQRQEETLQKILSKIRDLHEIKQAETQFTVGEAIVCAAVGWRSSVMPPKLDLQGQLPQGPTRKITLEPLLDQILRDCVTTTKPALKKATVIWLLSFVQFASEEQEVQERLRKIQTAFRRSLSNRDEFVQESASRGLSLVYEKGDSDLKRDLVKDLIKSFSSDRADMSGTVTEETQLFEPGSMPTGEGASVNTYKDIMSLASEIGDSSLVYHFMSLASNDTIWSSRAAFGRFGLNNILSDAAVSGYLDSNPKLYSKLYRYRFDPNPKVRRPMNEIWTSLVGDSPAILENEFDGILKDLLINIIGKEWRAREASCGAIAALIQGSKSEKVSPYLEQLWNCCFMVLDDIKDSVVVVAAKLSDTLTRFSEQRLELDGGNSETSKSIVKKILPLFFSASWLESKSKIHQGVAIRSIFQIIDKAKGETLRMVVPELVENLLNLLTKDQQGMADYIHLNAENFNMQTDDWDKKRAGAVRSSPTMQKIEKCLDLLKEETMPDLAKHLQNAMRTALSIPMKIGCSQVLMSLSIRKTLLFQPYADRFLDIVPKYLSDRSDSVATSYALALGYIARAASNQALSKLGLLAQQLYFESEDERSRRTSSAIIHGISKFATDRLNAMADEFLPFVFFALHDQDEEVKAAFKETWENNTGGPRRVLLYLREIATLCEKHMASNRWNIKQAAALTIMEAVKVITESKGQLTTDESKLVWPLIQNALSARSWDGKENLLPGFVAFVKHKAPAFDVESDIAKIALREAKRRNPTYQTFAIQSLAEVVAYVGESELSSGEVFVAVEAILAEYDDKLSQRGDTNDAQQRSEGQAQKSRRRVLSGTLDAIFQAMKSRKNHKDQASKVAAEIPRGLDLAAKANATSHSDHSIQSSLFTNLKSFLEDLQTRSNVYEIAFKPHHDGRSTLPTPLVQELCAPPDAMAHLPESVRLKRSEALLALAKLYLQYDKILPPSEVFALQTLDEKSPQARQNLQEAIQIFETVKRRAIL